MAIYYESKLALLSTFQTVANRLAAEHGHSTPLLRMRALRRFLSWVGKRWRLKFRPGCTLNRSCAIVCSEDGQSRSRARRQVSKGQRRSQESLARRQKRQKEKLRVRSASASL